ncbi:MAG: hypothetical protein RLZ98_3025 [Pseudomonadota bacterium]|jgi:HlyD family secretion protein
MPKAGTADSNRTDPLAELMREDQRIDSILRSAAMTIFALVFGVAGWAAMTNINGAVVATAKVVVEANSKSVQHLEGGIVAKIDVREGQRVEKGQLLIALDPQRVDEKISGLRSQIRARKAQLELMQSELKDLEALEAKRLVPRTQMVKARREVAAMEGEIGELSSELARFGDDKRRLEVRAPIAGQVLGLQVHTLGGVVSAGQEVMRIVPAGAELIIEGRVDPADIDQVRPGQNVNIRLSSFNQRTTPEVKGTVTNVSGDLVTDERKEHQYYRVHVRLGPGQGARLGGKSLVPGMPADIFIETDSRTVLSYLMKPLSDQLQRALKED